MGECPWHANEQWHVLEVLNLTKCSFMAVVPLRTDRPEFIPIFKRFSISLISVSRKRKLRFMERVLGRAISSYAFTLNSLGYTRE